MGAIQASLKQMDVFYSIFNWGDLGFLCRILYMDKYVNITGADQLVSDTLIVEVKKLWHHQADDKERLRRHTGLLGGTVRSLRMRSIVILPVTRRVCVRFLECVCLFCLKACLYGLDRENVCLIFGS